MLLPSLRWFYPFFAGMVLGTIAMAMHECGHLIVAASLGVRVKRIGLQGTDKPFSVREQGTVSQNLLIALAGPFVNLLLVAASPWYPVLAMANFCCGLANLLPIEGSDGLRAADCWRRIHQGVLTGRFGKRRLIRE